MALKLMVEAGDRIMVGEDCMIEVLSTGGRPQLAFHAPRDVNIFNVKADPKKMFKNRKRAAAGQRKGGSPRFDKD